MRIWLIYLIVAVALHGPRRSASGAATISNELQYVSQAMTNAGPALATLKTLGYRDLAGTGFANTTEIHLAVNGDPIPIYRVTHAALSAYHALDSLDTLLPVNVTTQSANYLIIPVKVGTKARSSISMRWDGTNWRTTILGRPDLIRRLTNTYVTVPIESRAPVQPFVLEIEFFDIWLIGYYNNQNQLILLTTRELHSGSINIAAHQPMTSEMMYRFASSAERYNFKPN